MNELRPKVAVFKFSSCDGCQLALLSLEDELLAIAGRLDIQFFLEARSFQGPGPYDIAFVEGSVTTPEDIERLEDIRAESKYLVSIGACATAGGIQALKNWADLGGYVRAVYATPSYIHSLETSTPIAAHVPVDFELNGCPISKLQLLELITSLLVGRMPQFPQYSVCIECKRRGQVCVLVSKNEPCMGPITATGCGAICPTFGRACYGCFGPSESAKVDNFVDLMQKHGMKKAEVVRLLRGFTGYAGPLRSATEKLERIAP